MCGIYGVLSKNDTPRQLLQQIFAAIQMLKNRGYDSCGVYMDNVEVSDNVYFKKFGIDDHPGSDVFGMFDAISDGGTGTGTAMYTRGIGHTRWATHGGKTDQNAHPHQSSDGRFTIVHNGIVSNYQSLKKQYGLEDRCKSSTDSEVIAQMFAYLAQQPLQRTLLQICETLDTLLEGTWACLIIDRLEPDRIYFMKNHNPLLIAENDQQVMFTSEPIGFLNRVQSYTLLREHCYGYYDSKGNRFIYGEHKEIPLHKSADNDLVKDPFLHWMRKEISDQVQMTVLQDPIHGIPRIIDTSVALDFEWIRPTRYLYLIGCGSSYYASLIAANYFRKLKAFQFVNVFDGAEFGPEHLQTLQNPEDDLLVVLVSQSGETRDLNIATTVCREYSKSRHVDPNKQIRILGIINVIGSLIARRTVCNLYTNCGRENAVASTKSCSSQVIACLLLAVYKSQMNVTETNHEAVVQLRTQLVQELSGLSQDIQQVLSLEPQVIRMAQQILATGHKSLFILGRDDLHPVALEGALKIKEVAYLHAEGFHMASLKHGPYALIDPQTPILLLTHELNHFTKSVIEELRTRNAKLFLVGPSRIDQVGGIIADDCVISLPEERALICVLSLVVVQLLAYHLSVEQQINPDMPRNLAKVVTVD